MIRFLILHILSSFFIHYSVCQKMGLDGSWSVSILVHDNVLYVIILASSVGGEGGGCNNP